MSSSFIRVTYGNIINIFEGHCQTIHTIRVQMVSAKRYGLNGNTFTDSIHELVFGIQLWEVCDFWSCLWKHLGFSALPAYIFSCLFQSWAEWRSWVVSPTAADCLLCRQRRKKRRSHRGHSQHGGIRPTCHHGGYSRCKWLLITVLFAFGRLVASRFAYCFH